MCACVLTMWLLRFVGDEACHDGAKSFVRISTDCCSPLTRKDKRKFKLELGGINTHMSPSPLKVSTVALRSQVH